MVLNGIFYLWKQPMLGRNKPHIEQSVCLYHISGRLFWQLTEFYDLPGDTSQAVMFWASLRPKLTYFSRFIFLIYLDNTFHALGNQPRIFCEQCRFGAFLAVDLGLFLWVVYWSDFNIHDGWWMRYLFCCQNCNEFFC